MSHISFKIFGTDDPNAAYIGWAPVPLTIINNSDSTSVHLKSKAKSGAITKLAFMEKKGDAPQEELTIQVGKNQEKVIYVAGWFQAGKPHNGASADSKDVSIQAYINNDATVAGSLDVMIRVRKNANELSDKARKDFLDALATLNGIGKGIYATDFVKVHVAGANLNQHGDSQFLPWHRLYILDLERLLQKINPAVTLPYWKFDKPAPQVFQKKFMGKMEIIHLGATRTPGEAKHHAVFAANNPLTKWQIESVKGLPRTVRFNPETHPADGMEYLSLKQTNKEGEILDVDLDKIVQVNHFNLISERKTLGLGKQDAKFGISRGKTKKEKEIEEKTGEKIKIDRGFSQMEGTPHGAAHVSFNGYINYIPTAPKDPLFFLLHCNVDRLWGKWQFLFDRHDSNDTRSYPYLHQKKNPPAYEAIGEWKLLNAKQWPWNGMKSEGGGPGYPDGKPMLPPGSRANNFTTSLTGYNFPGNVPTIKDTINYYAYPLDNDQGNYLGFACDDVPFDHGNNAMGVTDYKNKILKDLGIEDPQVLEPQSLFAMNNGEDSEDNLIKVLTDEAASTEAKQGALNQLGVLSIFSSSLPLAMPEYINAFRGLLDAQNDDLRHSAFSHLAAMKDEVAQKILKKELTSDKKEEDKKVPTHMAIAMLGHDEKALDYDILRKIAQNPPNDATLIEVVRHLPDTEENLETFQKVLDDHNAPVEARTMIPSIINRLLAPAQFIASAKKVIEQSQQANNISKQEELFPFLAQAVNEIAGTQSTPRSAKSSMLSESATNNDLETEIEATKKLFENLQVSPEVKAELNEILKEGGENE